MNGDKPKRPEPTRAPPDAVKRTVSVRNVCRNSAVTMAAQLRLIADLLENDQMVSKSGGIVVNSNHSGDVTIESNLVISCREQPTVEHTTGISAEQWAMAPEGTTHAKKDQFSSAVIWWRFTRGQAFVWNGDDWAEDYDTYYPDGHLQRPDIEEITLRDPLEEAVYQWLEDMGENDKKCMTFDFTDEDQCEAWKRVISNRGEYPPKLHSRLFVLKPFRTSVEVGFWAMRVL